jgi:hypothetical protein
LQFRTRSPIASEARNAAGQSPLELGTELERFPA